MSRKILIIDDNEIVGWALRTRLQAAEYDVQITSSALQAFALLKQERFDLLLLDLEMPGINGFEALAVMNLLDLRQGAPVVLLTASEEEHNVKRAHELGARGYLTKDAAASTLIMHIDRLFETPQITWLDDHTWVYARPGEFAPKMHTPPGDMAAQHHGLA